MHLFLKKVLTTQKDACIIQDVPQEVAYKLVNTIK